MKSKRRKTVSMRHACYLLFALCLCASILSGTASASTPTHSEPLSTTQEPAQYLQVPCAKEDAQYVGKHIETDEVFYYNVETTDTTSYANTNGAIEKTAPAYFPPELVQEQMNSNLVSPHTSITGVWSEVTVGSKLPYSAIAYLETTWPDGSITYGSAFMFYGDIAVTAGHCVYQSACGGWAKEIRIWVGTNGSKSSARATSFTTIMHVNQLWIASEEVKDDWGILELASDIGSKTGYLGITCPTGSMNGKEIEVSGYPAFYPCQQYKSFGEITKTEEAAIYHNAFTEPGQSGSPIMLDDNTGVIGIVHGYKSGKACGARITPSLFDHLLSFRD